jgi:hypothetical protein
LINITYKELKMDKIDIIKIDVPTFLRLLELSREDVKNDADLHFIAEIVSKISKSKTVTMDDYEEILNHSVNKNKEEHLNKIKKLSGLQ